MSAPLRVGLNLVYLVRRAGGAGTYARELIPELLLAEPGIRITAFASRELAAEDRAAAWAQEVDWVELPVTVTSGTATVVTLLDLIWMRHHDTMTARETLGMKLSAIPSARMADRVIAISAAARDDMAQTLGLDPARIDVTHLGVRNGGHP